MTVAYLRGGEKRVSEKYGILLGVVLWGHDTTRQDKQAKIMFCNTILQDTLSSVPNSISSKLTILINFVKNEWI